MIICTPLPDVGAMELVGFAPNGDGAVVRQVAGAPDFPLRGGTGPITTGGITLVDTEAPFGVPLTYRTTVTGISDEERLAQQNLILTPTFKHGVRSWLPGTNRTLVVEEDATAHSAGAVGHASMTGIITTPAAPPTLIGHKDTAVGVSGSYTLDPATPSGGGAIATDDWMLIVHTQLALSTDPADPAGWTRIDDVTANNHRQIIWKRKRVGGDTSYTVDAGVGGQSLGSLLWVRGSGDVLTQSATTLPEVPDISKTMATDRHAVIRPSLVVSIFSASATIGQGAELIVDARVSAAGGISSPDRSAIRNAHATISASGRGTAPLAGATMNYMVNAVTLLPRTLIVGTNSQVEADDSPVVSATYGSGLAMGFATQVAFQVADVLTNRVLARAKAAAIPATTADAPHLLTGRVRFVHPGLWSWVDVLAQGTWQNLKDTKSTWLDVRGTSSSASGFFLNLFATIVDPGTGADLVPPQRVVRGLDIQVNTWVDFSMLFANTVDIPATAEIRLVHGSTVKEFGIDWYLDEVGITPGAQRADHSTLYWFDGDSPPQISPTDLVLGEGWTAAADDAELRWALSPTLVRTNQAPNPRAVSAGADGWVTNWTSGTGATATYSYATGVLGLATGSRTNRALNPRAVSGGAAGWTSLRTFGTGGAGTYAYVTSATGPPNGATSKTVWRKVWTTATTSTAGSNGFQVNANGTNGFAVTPGETIAVSAWMRHTSTTKKTFVMRLQFWNQLVLSGATQVGSTLVGTGVPAPGGNPNAWYRISHSVVVPAGAASMQIFADTASVGDTGMQLNEVMDVTQLLIEDGTGVTDGSYFDGATVDTGDISYDWTGTANASTSTAITGIATARRKTWTVAATSNANSGFEIRATSTTYFPVTAGQTLTVSCWVRVSSAAAKNMRVEISFYDRTAVSGAVSVPGGTNGANMDAPAGAPGTWIRISHTITIPTDAVGMRVVADANDTGAGRWAVSDTLDCTGLQIEEAATTNSYFDGGTTDTVDYLYAWTGATGASISTEHAIPTAGYSVSEFLMASAATTTSECLLEPPADVPCEPLLLSDPTNVSHAIWAQLIGIGNLTHPANETINRVLKRKMAVAISQVRSGEEGELLLLTDTLDGRVQMLLVTGSGRALLIRIPDPQYPEAGWYVSVGDIDEARVFPDHRRPERLWSLPIVRVDRPTGLIEASGQVTWTEVLAMGDWSAVMAARDNWLEVLVGGDVP